MSEHPTLAPPSHRVGADPQPPQPDTIEAGLKLLVFTIVSILVTGLLAAIMGNIGFGAGREYQAIFASASMIEKGDDVRVAGVSVGEVKKVEHYERNHALVTFRVKDECR